VPIAPEFLAFAGVAALLTLSPGPDMAVMLRNVLRGGERVVVPTALGTCAGLLAWGAASSLGIAALMAASAELFLALRLAGAAYLVYLGLTAIRAALAGDPRVDQDAPSREPMTRWAAFRTGLLTNLLNPKIGVFYATLLPQFIPPGAPTLPASVALAGIHALENIVWLTLYGWLLARFGDRILRGRGRQVLEGLTGTVLLLLGVRVVVDALGDA
jgi:threonine/homoserine/homoserine lactone efflux protein